MIGILLIFAVIAGIGAGYLMKRSRLARIILPIGLAAAILLLALWSQSETDPDEKLDPIFIGLLVLAPFTLAGLTTIGLIHVTKDERELEAWIRSK